LILVTNDPIQYIGFLLVFVGTIFACSLLWSVAKATYEFIRWNTTRPPESLKPDDCVKLRDGKWALLRYKMEDDTWTAYVPAFGELQKVETIAVKDMRPIR
jgi:hypothetical protein